MMNQAYLSDTNFASALFVTARADHPKAHALWQKISASGGRIYLSRVAIAEIEYGLALNPKIPPTIKQEMEEGIKKYQVKEIGAGTTPKYAQIRADLYEQKGHRNSKGIIKTKLRPEFFTTLVPTSYELGIQENDLWMAAIAVELNMILITGDRMSQLQSVFPALNLENWQL